MVDVILECIDFDQVPPMAEQLTLIIVEDDMGSFLLTKRSLQRWGVTGAILHFKDGQSALEFLLTANFTGALKGIGFVVLLDLFLPGIDGFELMGRFRDNPKLKDIPVIVLTIIDDPQTAQKCYELGCDGFLGKPLQQDQFTSVMSDLGISIVSGQPDPVTE